MLGTIESLDRDEASAVLARAARLLLSTPSDELPSSENRFRDEGLAGRVVLELRERVATRSNTTEQLFLNLTEELSREMSDWTLAGSDLKEIRTRAGTKGTLTPDLYEISFGPHFEQSSPLYAISRSYVIEAIRRASTTEHLKPKVIHTAIAVSLFLQTPRTNRPPYTILVKCSRFGALLVVEDAFYLYHDSFDLGDAVTPRMALLKFLDRFGLRLRLDNHFGNPLEGIVFTYPDSGRVAIRNDAGAEIIIFNGEPETQSEIILAYSGDQHAYAGYLQDHGIKSRVPGTITTITYSTP